MAQDIWRRLLLNALRQLSITRSVRGFGDLSEYYKKSVDFEDLLFGIDPTYRDHTMHALWVYFLGDNILNESRAFSGRCLDWGIVVAEPGDRELVTKKKEIERKLENYRDAVHCIVALTHDLAYPFEIAEKVNARVEEMSKFIGFQTFQQLRYMFSVEQSLLVRSLLELVSLRIVIRSRDEAEVAIHDPTFVDMSQSFEQHRHGILSAYLLYRLVDTMGEIPRPKTEPLSNRWDRVAQLVLRNRILYAIASHTCDYAYSTQYNDFRFLLSLFDELEEFSRYKRLGRHQVHEICECGLTMPTLGRFSVTYRFKKDHLGDAKTFFERAAVRLCRMIDVRTDGPGSIRQVRITCIDAKRRPQKQYRLMINEQGTYMTKSRGSRPIRLDPDPETKISEVLR